MLFIKNALIIIAMTFLLFSCTRKHEEVLHGRARQSYLEKIKNNFSMNGSAKIKRGMRGWWTVNVKDGKGNLNVRGPMGFFSRRFDINDGIVKYGEKKFDVSLFFLGFETQKRQTEGQIFKNDEGMPDSLLNGKMKVHWLGYKIVNRVYIPDRIMVVYDTDTILLSVEGFSAKD